MRGVRILSALPVGGSSAGGFGESEMCHISASCLVTHDVASVMAMVDLSPLSLASLHQHARLAKLSAVHGRARGISGSDGADHIMMDNSAGSCAARSGVIAINALISMNRVWHSGYALVALTTGIRRVSIKKVLVRAQFSAPASAQHLRGYRGIR